MDAPGMTDESLKELLANVRTIAVVGLSPDPSKDSHRVAAYLKDKGYRIVPVNPKAGEVLGSRSYADLQAIPDPVEVVQVFRRPEAVPEIVDQAIAIGAKVLWLQSGIRHDEAAQKARESGMTVVQDACMMVEHSRLSRSYGHAP